MKTFCFKCKQQAEYIIQSVTDHLKIENIDLEVPQKHAFCSICQEEVFPDEIVDRNVDIANDAYREAIGSISVSEMQKIMDLYNIKARPLSLLLGWGENSIERQMKHTIPDKEHADQLKALYNPQKMAELLIMNGDCLKRVAYAKACLALIQYWKRLASGNNETEQKTIVKYRKEETEIQTTFGSGRIAESRSTSYTVSYETSPKVNISDSHPDNLSYAA